MTKMGPPAFDDDKFPYPAETFSLAGQCGQTFRKPSLDELDLDCGPVHDRINYLQSHEE
jgi:hypothetical protein